jgi:chaperonin ATPase
MRLLRNKWDELKCGRMNYWKESVFVVLLAVVVVVGLALRVTASQTVKGKSAQKITASGGKQTGAVKNVGDKNSTGDMPQTAGKSIQTAGQNNVVKPEDAVYTFLQGPKSWGKRLTWSGKWAETYYDGGKFGAFGCGFCCMANIYSSQTTYEASPVDIYKYTKRNTIYGGGGAVAWEYMESAMQGLGFEVSLRRKPTSYRKFQKMIASNDSAIVLVSSSNSACYWKNTPGHYVTVFLYDKQKDAVFLGDSGDPKHNRQWVALKKIYRSLKTESDYQVMTVTGYQASNDSWKHKKASGTWIRPEQK